MSSRGQRPNKQTTLPGSVNQHWRLCVHCVHGGEGATVSRSQGSVFNGQQALLPAVPSCQALLVIWALIS